jgi:hypothetical protein
MTPTSSITRLGSAVNAVVVQLPERRHPGIVIQGDSLHNLANLLSDAIAQLQSSDYEEAAGVVEEVRDIVAGYVAAYDAAVVASSKSSPQA